MALVDARFLGFFDTYLLALADEPTLHLGHHAEHGAADVKARHMRMKIPHCRLEVSRAKLQGTCHQRVRLCPVEVG